jgi:ABC-type multidrug transport system fused ATPase/permease subunit
VAQDVFVFNGSIRENILIGKPSATEREIVNACKKANIWDTVKELPNGLDTQIGVNGINLSGGQKQRLSIARIYLKNPPIVIFDEATSAIDDETEQLVMKEWEEVLSNRTAIIISHRKNTIMMCDSIAIMQDGGIASYGPLEDVMLTDKFKIFFNLMENANDWQKNALSH